MPYIIKERFFGLVFFIFGRISTMLTIRWWTGIPWIDRAPSILLLGFFVFLHSHTFRTGICCQCVSISWLVFFFLPPRLIRLWRSVGGWSGSVDQMEQVRILIFRCCWFFFESRIRFGIPPDNFKGGWIVVLGMLSKLQSDCWQTANRQSANSLKSLSGVESDCCCTLLFRPNRWWWSGTMPMLLCASRASFQLFRVRHVGAFWFVLWWRLSLIWAVFAGLFFLARWWQDDPPCAWCLVDGLPASSVRRRPVRLSLFVVVCFWLMSLF